jgi:hypothetical protein
MRLRQTAIVMMAAEAMQCNGAARWNQPQGIRIPSVARRSAPGSMLSLRHHARQQSGGGGGIIMGGSSAWPQ